MNTNQITQEETITVDNATQHDLGADPLQVHIFEGKVHTVQITRISEGFFDEQYDIEVTSGLVRSSNTFHHIATARGRANMWLIVNLFLNEKVDI